MTKKSVLVIGGGIAGIQCSIDLANMGFKVYLVEKSPSIGGKMAQLDKTFPTNDCSICILAPKMIECAQHENVTLLTYSEVVRVRGNLGDFRIRVIRKTRYIDEQKCIGCGECTLKCPVKVDDEFDMGLRKRKSIYLPFLQSVPRVYTIDKNYCLYLTKGKCGVCKKICRTDAIDFDQKDRHIELRVGAIVLATGFEPYYGMGKSRGNRRSEVTSPLQEYGYESIKNVVTGLQYERLLSASGPTQGEIKRPSDGKIPKKIAFIQCVGSRDERYKPYCSAVCCMHATKEAILTNEHSPDIETFIFYTDMRAVGKQFQEYIKRANIRHRVNYIRSRPSKITEDEQTKNPIIWYEETTTRQVKQMEVDMVILCQALIPSVSPAKGVAVVLGIKLDEYGFVEPTDKLAQPVNTSVPGIFACGYCRSPQDIPDSVIQASATAARVAEVIS